MSFGVTKRQMEENRKRCLANISKDEGRTITKCKDCPLSDDCSANAEEKWAEAIEKARLPNGKFGKLFLEEGEELTQK